MLVVLLAVKASHPAACVAPAVKVAAKADSVVHPAVKVERLKAVLPAVLKVVLAAPVDSVRKAALPAAVKVVLADLEAPAECVAVRATA